MKTAAKKTYQFTSEGINEMLRDVGLGEEFIQRLDESVGRCRLTTELMCIRTKKNIPPETVAKRMGLTLEQLYDKECGDDADLTVGDIHAFARALEVPPEQLFAFCQHALAA